MSKNRTCPFIYFLSLPLLIRPCCITTDHCRHGFNILSQARARCARVALFRSNHPQRRRQQDQMDLVQRAWANLPKRHRARCFGQLLVLECADGARWVSRTLISGCDYHKMQPCVSAPRVEGNRDRRPVLPNIKIDPQRIYKMRKEGIYNYMKFSKVYKL